VHVCDANRNSFVRGNTEDVAAEGMQMTMDGTKWPEPSQDRSQFLAVAAETGFGRCCMPDDSATKVLDLVIVVTTLLRRYCEVELDTVAIDAAIDVHGKGFRSTQIHAAEAVKDTGKVLPASIHVIVRSHDFPFGNTGLRSLLQQPGV
jgi:hypothetical protein